MWDAYNAIEQPTYKQYTDAIAAAESTYSRDADAAGAAWTDTEASAWKGYEAAAKQAADDAQAQDDSALAIYQACYAAAAATYEAVVAAAGAAYNAVAVVAAGQLTAEYASASAAGQSALGSASVAWTSSEGNAWDKYLDATSVADAAWKVCEDNALALSQNAIRTAVASWLAARLALIGQKEDSATVATDSMTSADAQQTVTDLSSIQETVAISATVDAVNASAANRSWWHWFGGSSGDGVDQAFNFAYGAGDAVTWDITALIRQGVFGDQADYHSGSYTAGGWTAFGVELASGSGIVKKVGRELLQQGGELLAKKSAAATAKEINQISHVFSRAAKNLEALVQASGSELNALRSVQAAANQALAEGRLAAGPNGILPGHSRGAVLIVNGIQVQLIGGRIVNGVVELGSFVGL